MKSNWWKLIVIVLVAVVVVGCAGRKSTTPQSSSATTAKSAKMVFEESTTPKAENSVTKKAPAAKPVVQPRNSVKTGDVCPPPKTVNGKPVQAAVEPKTAVEKPISVKPVASKPQAPKTTALANAQPNSTAETHKKLPKLLDLGADKCVPCKMMIPVLNELRKDHKGRLDVQFIDVWKDESAAEKYDVKSIPTQIFYDAKGKEFYRHVGYFPKEDILKVFRDHGIKLK